MDDTGNSSLLDTSEGALVVDLSHCTDDSKLTDTSRCTADDSRCTADDSRYTADDSRCTVDDSRYTGDDSRCTADDSRYTADDSRYTETSQYTGDDSQEMEGHTSTNSHSNGLTQGSQATPYIAPHPESGGNDEGEGNPRFPGEESATHRKVDQASNQYKLTPQKNIRSVLHWGPEGGQRNKYTPQKVDHKLAQLAVNAYMSPSKREGSGDPRRQNHDEAGNPHTETNSNSDSTSESHTSSNTLPQGNGSVLTNTLLQGNGSVLTNTLPQGNGSVLTNTLPQGNGSVLTNTLPVNHQTFPQGPTSQTQNPTESCNTQTAGEHHPPVTQERTATTNPAQTSRSMSHPADQYSQEMFRLYYNMQQNKEKVGLDDRSIPPDDDEEDVEDMDETCDQSDLSKMGDEMETSQMEEPAQLQATEVHCTVCNNWFMTMSSYTLHMAKHAQTSSPLLGLQCEFCQKSYLYEMEFKAHVQAHLEKQRVYKCRVCFKQFAEKSELQRHVKIHQDKKEFSCHFCGKEFHYTFNLKKHLRTHTGEKPYTCILCELKFTHKNSLNRHMSLHTNETEFECCVCDKLCPDRWTLQKHLASHQILTCSRCDQSFSNSKQLQDHQKTHQGAAPPSHNSNQVHPGDTVQGKSENSRVDGEIKQEPNQKPKAKRVRRSVETQCEICRKVFKNPGNYYRHLQSKEGMPVQTCDLCGQQFHDVYDLLKHTRQVHSQTTDTKGYSCRMCSQSFPDLTILTEHMSEHLQSMKKSSGSATSERNPPKSEVHLPLFCSICGKQCLNSVLLDLHMMEHSSSSGKSSENILDLSKSKEGGSQPPPRKRLKLETVDQAEPQEYYDSDKENEPLNLSKKKYSPRVKPRVLGVHQPQGGPSFPSVSQAPSHAPPRLSHKAPSVLDPSTVGLDLSTRSNKIVTDESLHKGDGNPMVCVKEMAKAAEDSLGVTLNTKQHQEGKITPVKPDTSISMEMTHDDSLEDKNDPQDLTSDHSRRTGSPSSLTCEYCPKTFTDPVTLNRHLSSHYKEWAFYCNYCNTMFTEEVSYKSHVPTHPSHTPYMCNVCSSHFSDRISLQAHVCEEHPHEKPFQCGVCQRRFPVKSYLGSHCRTHLTERPFKCKICERTFVHNFNLTKHMRTHTGEKPYTCAWCDRKFSQKNSLNRHEKIHMRETPSKGPLQSSQGGGGQLFSPGPGLEDQHHGRTTPYKSGRSTPTSLGSPHPSTPQSQHRGGAGQTRSRNSSASSTGTHRTTPEPTPQDKYPAPEVLQHMYMQQMAMMQHMAQQQQQGGSMNLMQNPYMMAAYMQQMHMMQQMAAQDPSTRVFPHTGMESMMSSYAKSVEEYSKNLEHQKRMDPGFFGSSHSKGT